MARLWRPKQSEMTPGPQSEWRIAQANRRGAKNARRKVACQDYAAAVKIPELHSDTIIATIADGMGSADLGQTGAKESTKAAIDHARSLLRSRRRTLRPYNLETILNAAMNGARMALEDIAERNGNSLQRYATTLLLVVYTKGIIGAAQIGDGGVVVADRDGKFVTFSKPTRGEYANETISVTSRRALQSCQIDIAQADIRQIALFTDGMVNLLLDNRTLEPDQQIFAETFSWLHRQPGEPQSNGGLTDLLKSDKVQRRTDDDTTLMLAAR